MPEIVVITHGNLALELVRVVSEITERPAKVIPVCLELHHVQAEYTKSITDVFNRLNPEGQVIILTDLFGGTPSNITFPFVKKDKVEVITGLNLPMLMYLVMHSEDKNFNELCEGAHKAGKDAIIIAGQFMS
ncbi:MAG: PTS sugar transporter subunit IIA [SAR324 cluster bacterium]|nr:PTS sugar transporter subunit IIA [SAR324 cluster bacterium]